MKYKFKYFSIFEYLKKLTNLKLEYEILFIMTTLDSVNLNNQPSFNVGMLGSVSDGKSTCVLSTTGVKTQRHSKEQTRNITIKPGYANMKIWSDGSLLYSSGSKEKNFEVDGTECELVNHLSFVDCPGHHELILTMLGSVRLMDAGVFVVSAAEPIEKKPQLIQHLAAVKIAGITNIIVCLNKLDLVDIETAKERYQELIRLLRKFDITPKAIIPTSFNKKIGINWLLEEIMTHFKIERESSDKNTEFLATRSFDVNKPGSDWSDIKGGVLGGSLLNGKLKVGDKIEIRPGICGKKGDGKLISQPIISEILSLETDNKQLDEIGPGGLIGVGTTIDPYYCKDDQLSGNIIGLVGKLPSVYEEIKLKYSIIDDFGGSWKPKVNDNIFLQIGTLSINSTITEFSKKNFSVKLSRPACIDSDSMIMISRKEEGIMKIVAMGSLISGNKLVN